MIHSDCVIAAILLQVALNSISDKERLGKGSEAERLEKSTVLFPDKTVL